MTALKTDKTPQQVYEVLELNAVKMDKEAALCMLLSHLYYGAGNFKVLSGDEIKAVFAIKQITSSVSQGFLGLDKAIQEYKNPASENGNTLTENESGAAKPPEEMSLFVSISDCMMHFSDCIHFIVKLDQDDLNNVQEAINEKTGRFKVGKKDPVSYFGKDGASFSVTCWTIQSKC